MKKIVIPHVKSPKDNTGLFLREGIYYVRYKDNGVKKLVSTGKTGVQAARSHRDALYAKFLKGGATVATRRKFTTERRAKKVKDDPSAYIRQRKPFTVVIDNQTIAECDTFEQAEKARDHYLGVK